MSGFTVGVYRNYDYPELNRQTPFQSGVWDNILFMVDVINKPCDVLVVLNQFFRDIKIECGEVWQIIQEPPIDVFPWVFEKQEVFNRIYSPYVPDISDKRFILSHGALPWHVRKTYDELVALPPPVKSKKLSWIVTNKAVFPGHLKRMAFLDKLKASGIEFDLFGYGFNPIKDKYNGLCQYRYSLAIENCSFPYYWTEKVADCFLSWTMPIYYGCPNLADYFPEQSFIHIDIDDPNVFVQIKDILESDLYLKNRDAIAEARRLILDKYQLFPFISNELKKTALDFPIRSRVFRAYKESWKSKIRSRIRKVKTMIGHYKGWI